MDVVMRAICISVRIACVNIVLKLVSKHGVVEPVLVRVAMTVAVARSILIKLALVPIAMQLLLLLVLLGRPDTSTVQAVYRSYVTM